MVKKITTADFKRWVKDNVGDEYLVVGEYTRARDNISMIHNISTCGKLIQMTPNNFKRGKRCKYCRNTSMFYTQEQFEKKVLESSKGRLKVTSAYKGISNPITVECQLHHTYRTMKNAREALTGICCSECSRYNKSKSQSKSSSRFIKELKQVHPTIKCLGEYYNTHTKLEFLCLICNNKFKTEPNSILRISGCPFCSKHNKPKGEQTIIDWLNTHKEIKYEYQKEFPGMKYIRQQRCDFYFPKLKLVIEYDGDQHYRPIKFFGGISSFNKQKELDKAKEDYLIKHGIKVVRITYKYQNEKLINKVKSILNVNQRSLNQK